MDSSGFGSFMNTALENEKMKKKRKIDATQAGPAQSAITEKVLETQDLAREEKEELASKLAGLIQCDHCKSELEPMLKTYNVNAIVDAFRTVLRNKHPDQSTLIRDLKTGCLRVSQDPQTPGLRKTTTGESSEHSTPIRKILKHTPTHVVARPTTVQIDSEDESPRDTNVTISR